MMAIVDILYKKERYIDLGNFESVEAEELMCLGGLGGWFYHKRG